MKTAVWTQPYLVTSFLSNVRQKLGLYSALNLLQDTAWVHAAHLGHGYESTLRQNMIWILTRQKLVMDLWPDWGETVLVRTWVRPPQGPFANRDFELLVGNRVIGAATSSFLLLDAATRQPVIKQMDVGEGYRTDRRLPFDAPKIALRDDLVERARFTVRNSDLDLHLHVNNTRYAQWIIDSVPFDRVQRVALHGYEVNFLAETHAGDEIVVLMSPVEAVGAVPIEVQFQGRRSADDKTVFAARLQVSGGAGAERIPGPATVRS